MQQREALDELADLLGPPGLLTDPVDLARYTEPFRGQPGSTPAVARPASLEEVRSVVDWARRHRTRVLPQGAASGLVGASTPPPSGLGPPVVVVSLERLDREPAIDPVDRTAVTAAGTRLSRLQEAAAPHGLTLPIDLGADPSLGGMVSTNTGGARMLRHGDMRRHVLGVRAVVADDDCTVIDELWTLRKHNVGPSLTQLFIGSSGAVGIVTDVAVDLEWLPSSRACAWVIPREARAALDVLLELERRHHQWLAAFEVVSDHALDAALAAPGVTRPFGNRPSPELSILVEFAGDTDAEEQLVQALSDLAELPGSVVSDALVIDPARAWEPRHRVSEGLRSRGTVLGFDVSVPRPRLPELRERVREEVALRAPEVVLADFGHWADGGIHCNLVVPPADAADPDLREALRNAVLGTVVDEFQGSFSAEHGLGPDNARWWVRTVPAPERELTNAIKAVFDPLQVLGHPGLPFG